MKLIEFALLAIGAVVGAYLRYRIVESPVTIYGLPVNVLIVNILGSFILGFFSIMSPALNLDAKYTLLVAVFCFHRYPCPNVIGELESFRVLFFFEDHNPLI